MTPIPAPPPRTYRDYLPYRPGFPLPFADRASAYAQRQEYARMQRRVEGSGW